MLPLGRKTRRDLPVTAPMLQKEPFRRPEPGVCQRPAQLPSQANSRSIDTLAVRPPHHLAGLFPAESNAAIAVECRILPAITLPMPAGAPAIRPVLFDSRLTPETPDIGAGEGPKRRVVLLTLLQHTPRLFETRQICMGRAIQIQECRRRHHALGSVSLFVQLADSEATGPAF